MTESLDNILSGSGEAVTEQNTAVEEIVTQAADGSSQTQQIEADEDQATEVNGQKMVPHAALHASKEKVKRYTEQVASFEKTLTERDQAWERRFQTMLEKLGPKSEPQPKPDWFENPEGATRHEVQQTVNPQLDQITQTLMANAQIVAGIKYGDDKVAEAEQAFLDAVRSQKLDPADFQKVTGSPNRYAAAVQWHQRQTAQAEIGDDPAAFKAKLEAELREKITAELQSDGSQQTQQRSAVMPSNLANARNVGNRSTGPAWNGPAPINDIFNRQRSG